MADPLIIASRYRVLRELGRGGMGVVYVVEHIQTGDHVALKLLHGASARDPKAIERFKREARASARIKSDHVVKVIDADVAPELENAPFLVMELLNGTDLERQVTSSGRLPPEFAVRYLGQAARALDKSHAAGIIHRDLKPENLFIHQREDGTRLLKILDFGISKSLGGDNTNDIAGAGMTRTGAILGTPLYMSPEQARGQVSEVGPTTDVWPMGLIAIFLLTGEIYWRANTVAELMVQILSDPLYRPTERWPWLPHGVDEWFARSCARDPKQRFSSVGEQMVALERALGVVAPPPSASDAMLPWQGTVSAATTNPAPIGARTTAAVASARPPSTSRRGTATTALLGLSVVGVVATILFIQGRTEQARHDADLSAAAPSVVTLAAAASQAASTPPAAVAPPAAPPPAIVVDAGQPAVERPAPPSRHRALTNAPSARPASATPPPPPVLPRPPPLAPQSTPPGVYVPAAP